jgi:hypothetical protein
LNPNPTLDLDNLTLQASTLLTTIKSWLEANESDTFNPTAYPDVVSAVLDCTATMALLTLSNILSSLQKVRSRSSSPESPPSSMQIYARDWREDPRIIEEWKLRAVTAFRFVQRESMIASKVLDFGMEQLRLLGEESGEGLEGEG